jgi:hypothetical protein
VRAEVVRTRLYTNALISKSGVPKVSSMMHDLSAEGNEYLLGSIPSRLIVFVEMAHAGSLAAGEGC